MGDDLHRLRIEPTTSWASVAASAMAETMTSSIAQRGRCIVALSGGTTPGPVYAELAERRIEWPKVIFVQADERLAPQGSADRNLTAQLDAFGDLGARWLPLPVDELLDPQAGLDVLPPLELVADSLANFAARLVAVADDPPVIDLAVLGLGADGHTASLLPGDPAADELRCYAALSRTYQGWRRLTLTRPVFDRARAVIWLVSGSTKSGALGRLLAGDLSIPAGLVRPRSSLVLADSDAARQS